MRFPDTDKDNNYTVEVTATDTDNDSIQSITVTIVDEDDTPEISASGISGSTTSETSIFENTIIVYTFPNETINWAIDGGDDSFSLK